MGKLAQRAAVAAAAVALTTVGFGGVAFAGEAQNNTGGAGGKGGQAATRCAVPVGLSGAVLLAQSNDVSQSNANGGSGGGGGNATNYN
jgi:hypothetical protein